MELLVIDKGMRARLVSMAHDYCGHVGTDKVTWTLRQNFTWPGMYKQINTYFSTVRLLSISQERK